MTKIASYPISYPNITIARNLNRSPVSSMGGASNGCTSQDLVSFIDDLAMSLCSILALILRIKLTLALC